MRPDRVARLVFSAASAVGRATGTLPDSVGASLQQVTAAIENASQRVRREGCFVSALLMTDLHALATAL